MLKQKYKQGFDSHGIHKVLAENERHVKDVQNRATRQLGIRSTLAARMRCSVVLRKSLGERRCDTFHMPTTPNINAYD